MSGSVYQTLNLQTVHFAAHYLPTGPTETNPDYAFTAHWQATARVDDSCPFPDYPLSAQSAGRGYGVLWRLTISPTSSNQADRSGAGKR